MLKLCLKATGNRPLRFCAILVPLIVSGCVVGPDYKKPTLATPYQWSKSSSVTDNAPMQLANWWQRLNDPMLDGLVNDAIANNNDVATAKAKLRQARATLTQTTGTLLPSLNGSSSQARSKSAGMSEGNQYQGGFDSTWELDLFGANKRAVEAAQYGLDASKEDLRATMVTLIGDVASYYVEARGLQQKIALSRRTAQSQLNTAKLTRDKYNAGALSLLDVSNADGLAATTQASIPQLEANLAVNIHRLSILTGRMPSALNDLMKKTGKIPQPKFPIPTGVPADILLTRPDVRVAERQYAQSTAAIGQKTANLYPSVSLTGNIATNATQISGLGKNSTISWAFGPSLSVPIFEGGQRMAAVQLAQAQRDQYFIAYRQAVLTALEDVENSLVNLSSERLRYSRLAKASNSYAKSLELSKTLFQDGNTSFLELLNAERSQFSADTSLIESRIAITTDYISLMKALGGGWDGAVDTQTPEVVDGYTGPHLINAKAGSAQQ